VTLYRKCSGALTFENTTDPRYTYEEAQTLLNAEEELNTSHRLMETTDAIIVRFDDLQLTRARAEEQIAMHNSSITRHEFSKVLYRFSKVLYRFSKVLYTFSKVLHRFSKVLYRFSKVLYGFSKFAHVVPLGSKFNRTFGLLML
jgi:hypothetical protein